MVRRYTKRRRVIRRPRQLSRYSRRSYKRTYARRRGAYGRYKQRYGAKIPLANKYVVWRASITKDSYIVNIQGATQDFFGSMQTEFTLDDFSSTEPISNASVVYQQYRFKRVHYKFIPFKRPMTAQILTPATTRPMNPPKIDAYVVPIIDKQTYGVKTDLSDILEQSGCKKIRNPENGFTISFVPKIEQVTQLAVLGNAYSSIRRKWLPTDSDATRVPHFGQVVYIRSPFDSLMTGGAVQEIQRFQVEVTAEIEFRGFEG